MTGPTHDVAPGRARGARGSTDTGVQPNARPEGREAPTGALSFTVPGDPVPWERCDSRSGRRYTAPRTREYQGRVKWEALLDRAKPIEGPVRVHLAFFRATARRCDWDNLAKSVCDALNGIAWRDDSQIEDARITKGVDRERPRVEVHVEALVHGGREANDSAAALSASLAASIAAQKPSDFKRILGPKAVEKLNRRRLTPSVRRPTP